MRSAVYKSPYQGNINWLGLCQDTGSVWGKMFCIIDGLLANNPQSQSVALQCSQSFPGRRQWSLRNWAMAAPDLLFKAYSEYAFSLIGKEKTTVRFKDYA